MQFITEQKQAVRERVRTLRTQRTPAEAARLSQHVVERLRALPVYREAETVLLYNALPGEVDVSSLSRDGHRFALPRVEGERLVMVEVASERDVAVGRYGIAEPTGSRLLERVDLAVVPGVAFDAAGHRLGRGGGYYDRLLARGGVANSIGVCFDDELMEAVPMEPHDVRVDRVVTPTRLCP